MDPDTLRIEILAGDHDDDLVTLHSAIINRLQNSDIALRWRFDWTTDSGLEVSFTQDDLTVSEAAVAEKMLGTTWADIAPARSANQCRALLMVILRERFGQTVEEATETVKPLTALNALECITEYQVQPAPLASPDSKTT